MFGFSRGGFILNMVVSLLRVYGVIHKDNSELVSYAIRMLNALDTRSQSKNKSERVAYFASALSVVR